MEFWIAGAVVLINFKLLSKRENERGKRKERSIMDEATKAEHPNLCQLLMDRLGDFGLDPETYGPYVISSDADEVPDVVELLKASSEMEDDEDDNDQIWEQFTQDILKSLQLDVEEKKKQEEEKKKEIQKLEQEKAEQNKQAAATASESQKEAKSSSSQMDDAQKQALMQRFGYETPEASEGGVGKGKGGEEAGGSSGVVTNKQAAAAAHMERAQELRSKKTQTKKEEQQKTKDNRASKAQLKEERRKKAQKGERKR